MMKPKTIGVIKEILFILLWWYVAARIFFIFRYASIALIANPEEEKELFWVMVWLNNYMALLGGGLTVFIELYLSPKFFNFNIYRKKFLAKSAAYSILSFFVAAFAYYYMKSSGFGVVEVLFNSEKNPRLIFNFVTFALFIVFAIASLNVIRDVRAVIGTKILRARLLGKYYRPKEEERIFMFIDLEASTTIAERLGHIRYSRLIQDCFRDISDSIINNKARVYQYVGDEVILTWNVKKRRAVKNSIHCFYSFIEKLSSKSNYYIHEYGIEPVFRAAINVGKVTVAEVGEVKKDISYHGDVLNTAARIQKLCKANESLLLCSGEFAKYSDAAKEFRFALLDKARLKGKNSEVEVCKITKQ